MPGDKTILVLISKDFNGFLDPLNKKKSFMFSKSLASNIWNYII